MATTAPSVLAEIKRLVSLHGWSWPKGVTRAVAEEFTISEEALRDIRLDLLLNDIRKPGE